MFTVWNHRDELVVMEPSVTDESASYLDELETTSDDIGVSVSESKIVFTFNNDLTTFSLNKNVFTIIFCFSSRNS